MKRITKLSKAKFKLITENIPNSDIELNFNLIIENFNLSGNFALIHWQAKPKGDRQWGVYVSEFDNYYSCIEVELNFGKIKSLQLDDKTVSTVPSAVLYYPQPSICTVVGNKVILGELLVSSFSS